MTEETYIICITKKMGIWNPNTIVKGSILKRCELCNTEIYVAPTSMKMLKTQPDVKLRCVPCLKNKMKEMENTKIGIVPGATKEFLKELEGE